VGVQQSSHRQRSAQPLFVHQLRGSLLALLISVVAIGSTIYHFSEEVLIHTVKTSLEYHAEFRKSRILALFEQQKRWMEESAEDEPFKRAVTRLIDSYQVGEDSAIYGINSKRFRDEYGLLLKAQGVDDLFLVGSDGSLVFSLRGMDDEIGVDLSRDGFYGKTIMSDLIEKVVVENKVVVSKYGKVEQVESSTVLMGVPLFSNFPGIEGDIIAIMVRPFSLSRLRDLIESYSGLGNSGEVMIAQWRGKGMGSGVNFINHFRNDGMRQPDEACQRIRIEKPERFPVLHALKQEDGSGWLLDNSCTPVFTIWSWLPQLEWGMVVKQDREEIMAPVADLQRNIVIAALLVLLFLIWVIQRQAKSLAQPIEELSNATERGEIDEHQPGKVEEVNHLARVLQQRTKALVNAKRETDLILESMDEGLAVVNSSGVIIHVNPKLELLVGVKSEQLAGRRVDTLFSEEQELLCNNGSTIPVSLSRSLLDSEIGEQGREVLVIHDLRELLKAENAVRANKTKDQFLAMMSHELRTPLTSIIGYSEMLGQQSWEHLQQRERNMLHSIEVAGRTQLALINDILDMSKIEAGKFEIDEVDFDLESLIDEIRYIFSIRAQDGGLDFQISQNTLLSHQLIGDSKRIGQVLMNLLSNAIKFTERGRVSLEVFLDQEKQKIHFRVEDEGIGMSPEVLDRLFQPFEQADSSITRRFGGTGLGLHISWILAELMGGAILVESVEGKGSCFQLNLPLCLSEKRSLERVDKNRPAQQSKFYGNVLLVEDSIELQKLEQYILESLGVSVSLASHGQEAVTLASVMTYDLILMDMQMPVMGGVEATQILRKQGYGGAIVALTANVMHQHQQEFKDAGCDSFLSKPIDQLELKKLLQCYLVEIPTEDQSSVDRVSSDIDPVILEKLHPVFQQRMSELQGELKQVLADQDWDGIYAIAHNIKGSAAPYGYPDLSDIAGQICDDINAHHTGRETHDLTETLIEAIDQVIDG
jgi:signal transduction histidine kinase/CheY-like chemotaxis protein